MKLNKAFTLLELLVVITIIGILTSIVVVSLSGSTDSADIAKILPFSHQVHALLGHQLVLDLNFNEGGYNSCPDGKDVCDASGYNNNGTIFNDEALFVPSDIDGYALSFDGVNDYVEIPENITGGLSEMSIEGWIKPSASSKGFINAYSNIILIHTSSGGGLYLTTDDNTTSGYLAYDTPVTIGKWNHVVAVWNGTTMKIYSNGQKQSTERAFTGSGVLKPSSTFWIGRYFNASQPWFIGLIDEIRVYSEALSTTEILDHYVQGLKKLMANNAMTEEEYGQRIKNFQQYLTSGI